MTTVYRTTIQRKQLGTLFGVMEFDFIQKIRPKVILPGYATHFLSREEFARQYDGVTMRLVSKSFMYAYFNAVIGDKMTAFRVPHSPFIENMLMKVGEDVTIHGAKMSAPDGKIVYEYSFTGAFDFINDFGHHQNNFLTQREPFNDSIWRPDEQPDFPRASLAELKLDILELRYNAKRLDIAREDKYKKGYKKNV